MHIVFPAAMALGGYHAPNFLLEKRIKKRLTILRLALPDALDLMVIAVEAGLGLDQAIPYVATELRNAHKELTEEFMLVNLEIRAGKRRSDALKNLGERAGEPELRKLTAILIQNDRFGTSVAESLRQHSDHLRVRRRQEAEERAAKVGVKLVFPDLFLHSAGHDAGLRRAGRAGSCEVLVAADERILTKRREKSLDGESL